MSTTITHSFVPKFDVNGRLMISYNRRPDLWRASQEKVSKRNPWLGRLQPNRGTIINTTATIGRNALVSIDGEHPTKLKRSPIAGQARPFVILSHRKDN